MKTQAWITGAALAGALLIGGGAALTATAMNEPAPTPTPTVTPTVTPTPTPTPTAVTETPAAELPPAGVAPIEEPPVEEPGGPVLCPPGTQSNGSDGYNDTSCLPDICWTIPVPDPAYPECDYAYPPEYYY